MRKNSKFWGGFHQKISSENFFPQFLSSVFVCRLPVFSRRLKGLPKFVPTEFFPLGNSYFQNSPPPSIHQCHWQGANTSAGQLERPSSPAADPAQCVHGHPRVQGGELPPRARPGPPRGLREGGPPPGVRHDDGAGRAGDVPAGASWLTPRCVVPAICPMLHFYSFANPRI